MSPCYLQATRGVQLSEHNPLGSAIRVNQHQAPTDSGVRRSDALVYQRDRPARRLDNRKSMHYHVAVPRGRCG